MDLLTTGDDKGSADSTALLTVNSILIGQLIHRGFYSGYAAKF